MRIVSALWRPMLGTAIVGGVAADYYGMHYYEAYAVEEALPFRVDCRPISQPGLFLHSMPTTSSVHYTLFYPRNGAVIKARVLPDHPGWLQLLSGDYIQRKHCGVILARALKAEDAPPMRTHMTYAPLPPLDDNHALPVAEA